MMSAPRYHPFSGFDRSLDPGFASVQPATEKMSKLSVGDAGANITTGSASAG
jgi:hypothetical protein